MNSVVFDTKLKLRREVAEWFCQHRRNRLCRLAGRAAYLVWRVYENRNFNLPGNGEEWLLTKMSSLKNVQCIFDVGANVGDWMTACSKYFPNVPIHAFEVSPPVFAKLRKSAVQLKNAVLNPIGLSDQVDQIKIYYSEDFDETTTAYPEHLGNAYLPRGAHQATELKSLTVPVTRGDDYAGKNGIEMIDILKIDVEGMEERVLRGLDAMFAQRRIRLVQFEYNTTNIVSKFLLRDAYNFFAQFGYKVGKLYPNYVEFRDYHCRHEDFCGPNMVAVHKDDAELLNLLNPGGQ